MIDDTRDDLIAANVIIRRREDTIAKRNATIDARDALIRNLVWTIEYNRTETLEMRHNRIAEALAAVPPELRE